jgi:histidine ammonia-lyase
MTAARHGREIITNAAHVLAIEAYTAARALDLRLRALPDAQMGVGVAAAYQKIRQHVPYQTGDAWWGPEIEQVHRLVASGDLIEHVDQAVGLE